MMDNLIEKNMGLNGILAWYKRGGTYAMSCHQEEQSKKALIAIIVLKSLICFPSIISDPYGRDVGAAVLYEMGGGGGARVEFIPREVGPHLVTLTYWGQPLGGSTPHTCHVYDVSRVRISPLTAPANVRQEVTFAGGSKNKIIIFRYFDLKITKNDLW